MKHDTIQSGTPATIDDYTIAEIKHKLRDPVYIAWARAELIHSGLFDALKWSVPREAPEPVTTCPSEFSAFQIGFFDNQQPSQDKRGRERASKTRHGLDLKVWADDDPDWRNPTWKSSCNLWSMGFALKHITKLVERGSLSAEFGAEALASLSTLSPDMLVGIPKSKISGTGTRYADGLIFVVEVADGLPKMMVALMMGNGVGTSSFVCTDAKGLALSGNCVAMARLTTTDKLDRWATEVIQKPNS